MTPTNINVNIDSKIISQSSKTNKRGTTVEFIYANGIKLKICITKSGMEIKSNFPYSFDNKTDTIVIHQK